METVFPSFVITTPTNKLLSYSSFIPVLTKGLQEQQEEIEKIKQEIQSLRELIQSKK